MTERKSSRVAMASDYSSGIHDNSRRNVPDSWVSGLFGKDGPKFERLEIWAGTSPTPKNIRHQATIRIEEDADPADLYLQIDGCAVGCGTRFVRVQAFEAGARVPASMIVWPVPPPPIDDEEEEQTDPKNLPGAYAGLLRQAYAHNEHFLGMVTQQTTALLMHLQSENKSLREERTEMRERLIQAENAASERDSKAFEQRVKLVREGAIIDGATTLVKAISTHVASPTGAAALGQAPPSVEAMQRLAESLTPEQFSGLGNIFTQEQLILLNSVLESAVKGQNAKTK